jgi:ATP-dependent helicase/nuclease subunit A
MTVAPTPTQAWRDSLTTPRDLPEDSLRTLECRQAARWLANSWQKAA